MQDSSTLRGAKLEHSATGYKVHLTMFCLSDPERGLKRVGSRLPLLVCLFVGVYAEEPVMCELCLYGLKVAFQVHPVNSASY